MDRASTFAIVYYFIWTICIICYTVLRPKLLLAHALKQQCRRLERSRNHNNSDNADNADNGNADNANNADNGNEGEVIWFGVSEEHRIRICASLQVNENILYCAEECVPPARITFMSLWAFIVLALTGASISVGMYATDTADPSTPAPALPFLGIFLINGFGGIGWIIVAMLRSPHCGIANCCHQTTDAFPHTIYALTTKRIILYMYKEGDEFLSDRVATNYYSSITGITRETMIGNIQAYGITSRHIRSIGTLQLHGYRNSGAGVGAISFRNSNNAACNCTGGPYVLHTLTPHVERIASIVEHQTSLNANVNMNMNMNALSQRLPLMGAALLGVGQGHNIPNYNQSYNSVAVAEPVYKPGVQPSAPSTTTTGTGTGPGHHDDNGYNHYGQTSSSTSASDSVAVPVSAVRFCHGCGANVAQLVSQPSDVRFCPSCGTSLRIS
jgi:hypothetical protein